MEKDVYHFILEHGRHLRGVQLLRYFIYGIQSFLLGTIAYSLLIAVYYAVHKYTGLSIDINSLKNLKNMTETTMVTIAALVMLLFTICFAIKVVLFILLVWILNKSCVCKALEVEEKDGGAASIRKVRIDGEEYTTKLYIQPYLYKKLLKNHNTFTLATDLITRRCLIL